MIGFESWPEPTLRGKDSWLDSDQFGQWRQADRNYRFASLDGREASDASVLKMTLKAEPNRPYTLGRWRHPEEHLLGDEAVGAMMWIR